MSIQIYNKILMTTLLIGSVATISCMPDANAMIRALNTAATGMSAQEANVNTISNNIANVNTTGFKSGRTEIEDLLYETVTEAGSRSSGDSRYNVGLQIGTGSRVTAVKSVFSRGSPQITNNPYDLMVSGEGFFAVVLPNSELRYTRDGSFSPDNQGNLVNKQGYKLFPGFVLPANLQSINISETGTVDAYLQGQTEPINLGQIPVFTFMNAPGLAATGSNMFRITESSGAPMQNIAGENGSGSILQGTLETSNVNIMTEMTNLIRAQRAYEMNAKVMGIADQMLQTVNNIR